MNTMFRKIKKIFDINNWGDRRILGILLLVAVLSSVGSSLFHGNLDANWWDSFLQNFSTEMFGAWLTFILLEKVVGTRDRKREIIRRIASADPSHAEIREARELGYLGDGSFVGADLSGANLIKTELYHADLYRVNLQSADLQDANLYGARLRDANLQGANLQGVNLMDATLRGVTLGGANLKGTILMYANLRGATLDDILGFGEAQFDGETTLPNGERWTPEADMRQFTHPEEYETGDKIK